MVMRVSESMKFSAGLESMARSQSDYTRLIEKLTSGKVLNRPSDDPMGMSRVLGLRKSSASVAQYQKNIDSAESWLTMTESQLSSVNALLDRAREIAIAQSTATASGETRDIAAMEVQQMIEQMQSLANAEYNGRYLFAGTQMEQAPFDAAVSENGTIGPAMAAGGNMYTDISAGGAYTGDVNNTYVVKIVSDGTLADAEYTVSNDGGKTWRMPPTPLGGGPIDLGDGVVLTFVDSGTDPAAGDIFYVQAQAPGSYKGNDERLSVEIGKGVKFDYSISGASAFTAQGDGTVDIFQVLNDLKTALESNDPEGIGDQLDHLAGAADQINQNIAECGLKLNRLEAAQSTLADLDLNLTEMISNTQDADLTDLITQLTMKETALAASYAVASKIGNLTLLDFLR